MNHHAPHFEIKSSRWQYMVLLIASLGFVATGVFLLTTAAPAVVGWAAIVFFGACSLVFVWAMVESRPRLIISDEGVFDRTLGIGLIPWQDIQGAYVKSVLGNDFICLSLTRPEKYLGQLGSAKRSMVSANEALGFTPFSLNLSGLDVDTSQVFELVMKKCEEAKR